MPEPKIGETRMYIMPSGQRTERNQQLARRECQLPRVQGQLSNNNRRGASAADDYLMPDL